MNISMVLSAYNNLELTKKCYKHIKSLYPKSHLIISSGGSTDGTKEWGKSLNDPYTKFLHTDEQITFSETYNRGVSLVETDKLVLIHNDMILGKTFLENLDKLLQENMLLSYMTIEPPIFNSHSRPGKLLLTYFSNNE